MRKLYFNADVITMDKYRTVSEAVLTEDDKIIKTGTFKELQETAPDAELVDMNGKTILPGFIDGHSHLTAASYDLMMANGNPSPKGNCNSVEELVEELKKQYEEKKPFMAEDDWFSAMGYDESVYPGHKIPTKYDLDKVCPDRPMYCIHASGHNAVFNSKALEICKIDENYKVPEGGAMPKFPGTNEYTGLLQENAFLCLAGNMKAPGIEDVLEALKKGLKMYASYGITTAQDAKTGERDLGLLQLADQKGILNLDVVCYLDPGCCEGRLAKQYPAENTYQGHVKYAGYKMFLDGSPQAKTAWLSEPYFKAPQGKDETYCGFPMFADEEVTSQIELCLKNSWQINVHTNGDEAIEQLIRCYGDVLKKYPKQTNLRPVFIHCQTVREDQLDRIKELNMQISFFEDHVYYWGDYHAESVLGEKRASHISPLASALERGISCTLHQDTPVVNPNVIFAVHNAVNRRTKNGKLLGPEQKVSVYDALKTVTINGAYQIFEEDKKGTLEPGKYADMVVLDKNPLKIPPEEIKDIKVLETIKKGESIYLS